MAMFKPASRRKLKLRMALCGPSGSGKTFTGLRFASALAAAEQGRIAVIDTEHRSASKYLGESPDGTPWQFEVCELDSFAPTTYTAAIREAVAAGFAVLLIDSLSHAWEGVGGALELVDKKAASGGGNSFTAWKDVTPMHREMVEAILSVPMHVIATMRTKMEYVLEEEERKGGRKVMVPKKVGMAPIQRAGMEYEFDVVGDMDLTQTLAISKTRCSAIRGQKIVEPPAAFMIPVQRWLDSGCEEPEVPQSVLSQATTSLPVTHRGGGVALSAPACGIPMAVQTPVCRDSDRCSPTQAGRIKELAQRLGMEPAAVKSVIARRGAARIADLTVKQADELTQRLEAMLNEQAVPVMLTPSPATAGTVLSGPPGDDIPF